MNRIPVLLAIAVAVLAFARAATAVPPGLTVQFDGGDQGKVTFSGARHAQAGLKCADCHMGLFYVARSVQIARADHRRHQACFACHDGKRAFAAAGHCDRCHVEPEGSTQVPAVAEVSSRP